MATAVQPDNALATANGTTDVDVWTAGTGERVVLSSFSIHNADTVSHVMVTKIERSGSDYVIDRGTVTANNVRAVSRAVVLVDGDKLQFVSDAGATTTEPTIVASGLVYT